jgi:hypothetical protein
VVFLQQANGLWSNSVLDLIKDPEIVKTANKQFSESVLCTLVGLKLLKQNFGDKQKLWKLVAQKGAKALTTHANFTDDVEKAVNDLQIELK